MLTAVAVPPTTAEAASLRPGLDAEATRQRRICADLAQSRGWKPRGEVTIALTRDAKGHARDVELVTDTTGDAALGQCLVSRWEASGAALSAAADTPVQGPRRLEVTVDMAAAPPPEARFGTAEAAYARRRLVDLLAGKGCVEVDEGVAAAAHVRLDRRGRLRDVEVSLPEDVRARQAACVDEAVRSMRWPSFAHDVGFTLRVALPTAKRRLRAEPWDYPERESPRTTQDHPDLERWVHDAAEQPVAACVATHGRPKGKRASVEVFVDNWMRGPDGRRGASVFADRTGNRRLALCIADAVQTLPPVEPPTGQLGLVHRFEFARGRLVPTTPAPVDAVTRTVIVPALADPAPKPPADGPRKAPCGPFGHDCEMPDLAPPPKGPRSRAPPRKSKDKIDLGG